jgi:hydroxymethylpyrimidine pyrophosphatase-like HAD family hydrolase
VKLSVIALDYDGTIARHDRLDPSVLQAIAAARTNGIVVLLVTGRILSELQRVAGDLRFVDGVIAENGAVMFFPETGHQTVLAPLVPDAFLRELRRLGVPHHAGHALVDADAGDAARMLDVIRALEVPLVLLFNGGRVMALPQGVSKATGLHALLDTLRLSARNTLAIGDRENDHELLRLAEVGAAVAWGSAPLKEAADVVVEGDGPAAVGAYILGLAASGRLPTPASARRRLRLGFTEDGREFSLAARGRNVLVAGDARSGKSWVAGLLCEQLILYGYCVCVVDPEGDYRSLEALPGVSVLGGEDPPPTPRELVRALRFPDRSVVIDLSRCAQDEKIEYIRATLPALNELRRRTGLPHRILLDEAHYFLHDDDAPELLDLEGHGYTVVTYRASRLPPALLADTEVMIVTRESNHVEIDALKRWCASCGDVSPGRWALLSHLRSGQAVALPITEEAAGDIRLFTVGPRLTAHVRHREKYVDVPVSERQAFFLTGGPPGEARSIRTLRQLVNELEEVPAIDLEGYLRRGDFSRWIGDVFGDFALAAALRRVEARYSRVNADETVAKLAGEIRARYDLSDDEVPGDPGRPPGTE